MSDLYTRHERRRQSVSYKGSGLPHPLEDVDLEATFRSGHRRRQTCETAANDR